MESWKKINKFPEYLISDQGRLKSIKFGKERLRKPIVDGKGYMRISLSDNGFQNTQKIYRLVAIHFIPNPENKPQVNHKNGIKADNRAENLEWCTHQENMTHASVNGLMMAGENNSSSILNSEKVIQLRQLHRQGNISIRSLAKKFEISYPTARNIIIGKKWKKVT